MNKTLLSLTAALALWGCLTEEEPEAEELTEAQVQALSEQTTEAMRVATLMANGFGSLIAQPPTSEQEHLEDAQLPGAGEAGEPRGDGGGGRGDGDPAPMMGEGAEGCSRLEWNVLDPLRLTAYFTACPQETGETLTGSASIFLQLEGDENSLGVEADLRTETWSLEGFFVITAEPGVLRFNTDIDYAGPSGSVRLILEDATITTVGEALVLDGSGTVTVDGQTWSADAMGVTYTDLECAYPTSGSANLTLPGSPPITLVFAEEDGTPVVYAQFSALPPIPYYPTC